MSKSKEKKRRSERAKARKQNPWKLPHQPAGVSGVLKEN